MQEEDSLLVQFKPKSTWYKDKWVVEVFRTWQAACKPKFCIFDLRSMFKEYNLQHVQSLEEKLEDLDSVSLTIGSQKLIYQYNGKLPFSLVYVLKLLIAAIRAIG